MPIRLLSDTVASQIAAGEVVERPASVIKEAVENSIDANARDIRVEIHGGGKERLLVTDDGSGVASAEVELAFHRHSTSKLASTEDLNRITTLGFRGEALASIAAVSRMTFITRAGDEPVGTLLRLEGGRIMARQEHGRAAGTTLIVEDLFFNVPARRKFLRSDETERRHIDAWLTRYSMAYPELRFTLNHAANTVFQSPGSGRLRDVMVAVYGLDVGAAALDVIPGRESENNIRVEGLVSPPSLHRANRSYITLFVNGRWIQDTRLTYAVVQAYHTLLPTGRYPLAVLMISLPPDHVDVNVHPTKSEVRFSDGDAVFRTVQQAVRRAVLQQAPVPPVRLGASAWPAWGHGDSADRRERFSRIGHDDNTPLPFGASQSSAVASNAVAPIAEDRLPPLRVIGQLKLTYIIAEGPDGLYLIDQHAAHERVLFERLLAERQSAKVASQALLEPLPVELAPEAAGRLVEYAEALTEFGFRVEPFGGTTVLLRAVPAIVAEENPVHVLDDVAAALGVGDQPLAANIEETVAREVCKRASVKAGRTMAREEMEQVIRALEQTSNPRTCPHGRPTMIHLSATELAHAFNR
ncbi:MAG: DNA mismatch repair endonuclease MutL [Chloroflexi bacterium]|nr:DNA mismatch repair endonuclease MutL [Chloroflexota bacterium]